MLSQRRLIGRGIPLVLASGLFAHQGMAQSSEALFLLLPMGAQSVGMGQAAVAQRGGSEAVWWNPSAIAGDEPDEAALHHSQTIVGQGNTATFVIPTRHVGTVAASLNVLDLEEQTATDNQDIPQGVIYPTNVIYALTYAAAISPALAVGATVKHAELRVRCSGLCTNLPSGGSSSNILDLGTQIRFGQAPWMIGIAARNLGGSFGSMSPARLDMGANYRVQVLDRYTKDVQIYGAGDVVSRTALDSASIHLGTDVVFQQKIHLRGGYIVDRANGSGGSVGFGVVTGSFVFDLARTFGGLSSDGDKPPTYFSLRYLW